MPLVLFSEVLIPAQTDNVSFEGDFTAEAH